MNGPPNGRPTHGKQEPRCHALQLIASQRHRTRLKQERGFSPILEGQALRRWFARILDPIRLAHPLPPDERRANSLSLLQGGKSAERSDTTHIPPWYASCRRQTTIQMPEPSR
jgi:hypothetical protein